MINEVRGVSFVLPVHSKVLELKLTLESFLANSNMDKRLDNELIILADRPTWQVMRYLQIMKDRHGIQHKLVDFGCLYKTWNYGIEISKRDWVCLLVSDLVFSPGWDTKLISNPHMHFGDHNKIIAVPTVVQCNSNNSDHSLLANLSNHPLTFDYNKFLGFVRDNEREIVEGQGFLTPILVHKYWLNHIGGYWTCDKFKGWTKTETNCRGGCGYDNDFRDILKREGFDIKRARNSIVYHFDGSYQEDDTDLAQMDEFINKNIFG